jgi:CheY-like chemotaxis protein
LVVDDDSDQRLLVSRLLARSGFTEIAEASDGDEAVRAAQAAPPDLILLDLAMPGRSGFEVLDDLRDAAPLARIVILSNLPSRRLAEKLRQRGAVGYVEKRVAPDQLVRQVLLVAAMTDVAEQRVAVNLTAHHTAVLAARRFVRGVLEDADRALVEDVELLVSELVTNAVVHATSAPRLEVRLSADVVHVAVHDADPSLPVKRAPDADRPGGRGLQLIERLASRWDAAAHEDGKVVWFEIDRSDRAS